MKQLSLLLSLLLAFGQAQSQDSLSAKTGADWEEKFFQAEATLPLLMEAAITYSPEIEKLDLSKAMAGEDLKIKRRDILSGIALGTGYTYGSRVGLATPEGPQQNQLNAFVLPAQAQYNVGVMLSLPITQVLNRNQELNKQKMSLQQAEADRKLKERQLRHVVISLYQDIVLAKAQLKLHQEAFQTAHIHFKLAEKQFETGELLLSEMAKINETYSAAAIAHGTAKIKYATSFLLMEEMIGMKIYDLMSRP
ncbi:MAG: TolC family protein [Adhaeribacter sp.]